MGAIIFLAAMGLDNQERLVEGSCYLLEWEGPFPTKGITL